MELSSEISEWHSQLLQHHQEQNMHHTRWESAIDAMHEQGSQLCLDTVQVGLTEAIGRTLSEPLQSLVSLPHYDSSAMDGYAVCGSGPWVLKDGEELSVHENRHRRTVSLDEGEATTILTGGLIPPGTTAVIRLEWVHLEQQNGETLVVSDRGEPQPGSDMRTRGEEISAGTTVLEAGTVLSTRHLAFLAVCGFDTVPVFARPSISIAYTGNEVITSGIPAPGEVRDAYSAQFPFIIEQMGARVISTARLHDDMQELRDWFASKTSTSSDILILTGGSSTSEVDLVRKMVKELGGEYIFEAVAVRPGHPCLAATLPDGRTVIGLPGNPLAAHTSLYSYLPAYLAGAFGRAVPARPDVELTADVPALKRADVRLIPAQVEGGLATPYRRGVQSHMLSAFAEANALVAISPDGAQAGDIVSSLPLEV